MLDAKGEAEIKSRSNDLHSLVPPVDIFAASIHHDMFGRR